MENNMQDQNMNPNSDQYGGGNFNPNGGNNFNQYRRPVRRREIALCIIFALLTCGIYGIYWMIVLNDDINELVGDREATSGGMVFLLTFISCGIYGLYWLYSMGRKIDSINGGEGSSGVLYLVLSIVGLPIVAYAIMQDNVNRYATIQ